MNSPPTTTLKYVSITITCGSRKWRIIDINKILIDDLIIKILSRLPVKDLLQYRSVCKKWRSLIDDPNFISMHLRNYNGNNSKKTQFLVVELNNKFTMVERVALRRRDTFAKVVDLQKGFDDGSRNGCYYDLSYINGVMLIKKEGRNAFNHDIILWNPSLNRSLNIFSCCLRDLNNAEFFEVGLGFDVARNDLKVVAIVYPRVEIEDKCGQRLRGCDKRCYGTIHGFVHLYSLRTKCWSSNQSVRPPPYWSEGTQVFFNGCIHWTNLGPEIRQRNSWRRMKDSHIVAFDVSNEVFRYFELPSQVVENYKDEIFMDALPIVLDGMIGMFYEYHIYSEVWVMEEYGVPKSWKKYYKFEVQIHDVLDFTTNGELLYILNGEGIMSYDVRTKLVKRLKKTYYKSINYRIYPFVESLVLGWE